MDANSQPLQAMIQLTEPRPDRNQKTVWARKNVVRQGCRRRHERGREWRKGTYMHQQRRSIVVNNSRTARKYPEQDDMFGPFDDRGAGDETVSA